MLSPFAEAEMIERKGFGLRTPSPGSQHLPFAICPLPLPKQKSAAALFVSGHRFGFFSEYCLTLSRLKDLAKASWETV